MQDKAEINKKQPYDKPRLREIELTADEVLAAGCKTGFVDPAVAGQGCTTGVCSSTIGS